MRGGWPSGATPTGPRAFVPTSAAAAYGEACAFLKGRESRRLTGAAVARVETWRNRPPECTRRSTARNPNPNQLSMPL
jgi:hypothetical protein